jgi:hypothetical protein
MFRFAANDIISKCMKIKTGSGGRLSPRRRGEDKGEGLDLSRSRLGCLEATLTLPLSLSKGEATHARTWSSPYQKSLSCFGNLNMTAPIMH